MCGFNEGMKMLGARKREKYALIYIDHNRTNERNRPTKEQSDPQWGEIYFFLILEML